MLQPTVTQLARGRDELGVVLRLGLLLPHFMWREADGFLDCVCTTCGWTRRLNADDQGHAGPLHVMIHARHCSARLTDEELEAGRITLAEQLVLDGA